METAARLALRGHGGAEPNPMVGCVIVSPKAEVVGWGYHRQCGGPHAEIEALRRAGPRAAGGCVYVTLEPCNHAGRTGPCSQALVDSGVARVVFARADEGADASGGAQRLREAGTVVATLPCPAAIAVSEPFIYRRRTSLPWVIAKWAQTVDGRIATRTGHSQWISGENSRHMVHRERGRVDAILTGIGTVLADDPLLTARNVRKRRIARRVVIDPQLRTPLDSKLVKTATDTPTIIVHGHDDKAKLDALRSAGVEIHAVALTGGELPLPDALAWLAAHHEVSTVLVEAGPGLLGRLFNQRLVNEAWVFIGPMLLGDAEAPSAVRDGGVDQLTACPSLERIDARVRGGDVMLRYWVSS